MDQQKLSDLKDTLKHEFEIVFDKKAFNKYYAGVGYDGGFNHKQVASQSNIKYVHLHRYLGNYFMAYALDRATSHPRYAQQKAALLKAFRAEAPKHLLDPDIKATEEDMRAIIDAVEETAEDLLKDFGYCDCDAA